MIGSIAKNLEGRIGVVTGILIHSGPNGRIITYAGIGFDGKSWESKSLCLKAMTMEEYLLGHCIEVEDEED